MRQIYILFAVLFLFSINQAFSQQLTNTYIADKIIPLMEKKRVKKRIKYKFRNVEGSRPLRE